MSYLQKLRQKMLWIPGSIWGLSIAIGLMAVSVSMTFSISPFFLTSVLGLSMFSMGAIEGFTEGLSQISKLFSGMSGDLFRRKKPTLVLGFLLSILSKPFFILASGSGMVIFSKILERTSNGIMSTPRDAYVAEASPEKRKGSCFGIMMSFKTGGCVVGSLFIGALLLLTDNYRLLLWFGFGAAILSCVILCLFMNEKVPETTKESQKSQASYRIKWDDFKALNFNYWSLLLVASLFMCARFSDGFLILRVKELGGSASLGASLIGIFNLISALCCFPIGRLSDRFDRSKVLYFSIVTLILSNVCFFLTNSLALAMLGVLFWGAQRGTSQILFCAMISDEAPKQIMGTAMGIFFLTTGVIALIAGSVAGKFADMSLHYAFIFGAVMSTLSFVLHFLRNQYIAYKKKNTAPIDSYHESFKKVA